jgi:hypothetical protein
MSSAESRRAVEKGYEELEEAFPQPETLRLQEYSQAQSNPITAEEVELEDDQVRPDIESIEERNAVEEDDEAYKSNPGVLMGERTQDIPEIYHYKPDNRGLQRGFRDIPENRIFVGIPGLLAPPGQQGRSMGVDWGRTNDEMRGVAGTLALYQRNYEKVNPVVGQLKQPFTA